MKRISSPDSDASRFTVLSSIEGRDTLHALESDARTPLVDCFSILQRIMSKLRFTQDRIAAIVSELNAGKMAAELSRHYGVSVSTLYRWRSKCANKQQPTADSQRLRSLEDENQRLKRQFAELTLDYATLRAALIRDVRGDC